MKIIRDGERLRVSEVTELAAANSRTFQSELADALPAKVNEIEIDLSDTSFLDCGGVGALVGLRKCASRRNANVAIRLLNPTASARRIFKLIRMEHVFSMESGW